MAPGATATNTLGDRLGARWARWLHRRIPPASTVTLDQRRIFIFPSGTGLFFALNLLVMLVAAINYQSNISYALTFLLANLFVVAVLHSYANLAGLTITAVHAEPAFVGQRSALRLRLSAGPGRGHYALTVGWPQGKASVGAGDAPDTLTPKGGQAPAKRPRRRGPLGFIAGLFSGLFRGNEMLAVETLDLEPGTQRELRLHLPVDVRGWYRPGRLLIESVYPLGLLRCWTWVDLDFAALVYPRPRASQEPEALEGEGVEGLQLNSGGDDEFYGMRDYREGDNLRRVYWKGLARGQALQSMDYASAVSDPRWLDWDQFPGLPLERRLSALCYWVLDHHRRELEFGLRLPGVEIVPAKGDRQRDQCLRALALFRVGEGTP